MARRTPLPPFIMSVDTTSLDRMIEQLGVDVGEAVRPAAQAAAQVFYDEVKRNVGQLKTVTGNLNKSIYQVYNKALSVDGVRAVYDISWNKTKAPHGWLVERGHLQRYRYYQNAQGQVRPMVRPGMDGKKKPAKGASRSAKDEYYVTLDTPIQISGKAFIRNAIDKQYMAVAAAKQALLSALVDINPVYGGQE
jgi:hypothetical protein